MNNRTIADLEKTGEIGEIEIGEIEEKKFPWGPYLLFSTIMVAVVYVISWAISAGILAVKLGFLSWFLQKAAVAFLFGSYITAALNPKKKLVAICALTVLSFFFGLFFLR